MSVSTNDLRNGMTLNLPEGLFNVIEFQHVKPGKGGAFVRTKLKNQRTGAVIERTYRADEKLEQAIIDKREMQFLYRDGGEYVFMDTTSYEQLQVATDLLGDAANYLKEGDDAVIQFFGTEIVGVELPGRGGADRHRDRARTAGRPGVRCPQAGHRRDRPGDPGPPVRQSGREGQGRHPHRRVPDPGLTLPTGRTARCGSVAGPPSMSADPAPRHQSRERALTLLYEADLKGESPDAVLAALPMAPDPYVVTLMTAVADRMDEIDDLVGGSAIGWDLDRMAVVDRNVLRLATAELLTCDDVPTAVILNEAVELASAFSTDDSGRFVNGVLATIATRLRTVDGT